MSALVPELSVRDWRRSVGFYVDMLGFSSVLVRPDEGFAIVRLGAAKLMLDQIGTGRDFQPELADKVLGLGVNLQIEVPALDPLLLRIEGAAMALHLPLEEKWYRHGDVETGNRQFIVADPDGYLLRFFEDMGTRPRP